MKAASLASTGLGVLGALRQGSAEAAAGNATAASAYQAAGQQRAVSQREAERQRIDNRRLMSRQRTVMAANGFDSTDATSRAIVGETAKEATLQELLELAKGEDAARMTEYSGQLAQYAGQAAKAASRLSAGARLISGALSWRDRFGDGGKDSKALMAKGGGGYVATVSPSRHSR
ncbi:MAG: hypothetical protein EBR82_08005 [Caulobacteraceae bacterium]|nr:hypothetical protein [Caulobacteraceae bacterium]